MGTWGLGRKLLTWDPHQDPGLCLQRPLLGQQPEPGLCSGKRLPRSQENAPFGNLVQTLRASPSRFPEQQLSWDWARQSLGRSLWALPLGQDAAAIHC